MRHATPDDLKPAQALLQKLRSWDLLTERKPGTFYIKSQAFLHFHGDPEGLFADVRMDGSGFQRFRVSTKREQGQVIKKIDDYLSKLSPR